MKIASENVRPKAIHFMTYYLGTDRPVFRTLRCSRSNPGLDPCLDRYFIAHRIFEKGSTERDQNEN